jgi:hypothetical protein
MGISGINTTDTETTRWHATAQSSTANGPLDTKVMSNLAYDLQRKLDEGFKPLVLEGFSYTYAPETMGAFYILQVVISPSTDKIDASEWLKICFNHHTIKQE